MIFTNINVKDVFSTHLTWTNQTCRKFESFRGQNLDFQKFPQKYMSRDILNFQKYGLICNIIKEVTRNQADLDLSER